MKKFFAFASLLALTLSACTEKEHQSEQKGEGQVTITLATSAEVDTRAQISCTTPKLEDFALTIEGADQNLEYASVAEFNEDNYLHFGRYKATVVAGDVMNEGYDKATFVGSKEFSVSARKHTDVEITAHIANALVVVETTEAFNSYFEGGHTLKLVTAAGNEFNVTNQSELLFIAPELFTISGTATKQPAQSGADGVVVTLPEYKQESVAAQTLYTVKFDVETAGSATLVITLNETPVYEEVIDQELNDNAQ